MEEHKISISRSDAFRTMPLQYKSGSALDAKLISSLKEDGMLEDENEIAARERLLEAQYSASALRNVMNPRYMRDREGKNFKVVQQLDGIHIERPRQPGYVLWPLDPDREEKEGDMVGLLRASVVNSEAERNKYLTRDMARSRTMQQRM
jgi:hypothetical protein